MAYLEYFDERRIELQRELRNHPDLIELIQEHPQDEFEIIIAEIAAYCDVVLDGEYLQSDLDKLCGLLTQRLREKRGKITVYSSLSGGIQ